MTSFSAWRPDDVDRVTPFGDIVQIAFHAPDIAAAAQHCAAHLRAGPFFLLENIALSRCLHRGAPAAFDHSSAYGQYGDVMVELIRQNDDQPSAVRDMFSADQPGLHHVAVFVENLDRSLAEAQARGMATALDATTAGGVRFAMVDARAERGCMIEFYEPTSQLSDFYAFVKRQSADWDGADALRPLAPKA